MVSELELDYEIENRTKYTEIFKKIKNKFSLEDKKYILNYLYNGNEFLINGAGMSNRHYNYIKKLYNHIYIKLNKFNNIDDLNDNIIKHLFKDVKELILQIRVFTHLI